MTKSKKETKGTGMHPTNPEKDNTTKFDFHCKLYLRDEKVQSLEYGAGKVKLVQEVNGVEKVVVGFTDYLGRPDVHRYEMSELYKKNSVFYVKNEQIVQAYKLEISEIQELINNRADVNAKDKHGFTALYLLTHRGNPDTKRALKIAKQLIDAGADVNFKDQHGNGILEPVINPNFISLLLDKGIINDNKYTEKLVRNWRAEIEHLKFQMKKKCNKKNVNEIEKSIIDLKRQIEMIETRSM